TCFWHHVPVRHPYCQLITRPGNFPLPARRAFPLPCKKLRYQAPPAANLTFSCKFMGQNHPKRCGKGSYTMVDGRAVLSLPKTARWVRHCAIGALLLAGPVPFAFAQGGQSEYTKTTPSNPPPPAPAPAPAPAAATPAPAPAAAKSGNPVGGGPAWQTNV